MGWMIGLVVAGSFLASWMGRGSTITSTDASSGLELNEDGAFQHHQSLFDDDSMNSVSSLSSSFPTDSLLSDSMTDCSNSINPANGLPMIGCIDIEGNPFGTDFSNDHSVFSNSIFDDSLSSGSTSLFEDSFSSSSSSSSMFD